jgi:hypothetical protein
METPFYRILAMSKDLFVPLCFLLPARSGEGRLDGLDMTYIQNTGLAISFFQRLIAYAAFEFEQKLVLCYTLTNYSGLPPAYWFWKGSV